MFKNFDNTLRTKTRSTALTSLNEPTTIFSSHCQGLLCKAVPLCLLHRPHASCCPCASSGSNPSVPPAPQLCLSLRPLTWSLFWNPFSIPLCFPEWCIIGCTNSVCLECFHQLYCGGTACLSFCNKELKVADIFVGRRLIRRFYLTVRTDSQQFSIWKS